MYTVPIGNENEYSKDFDIILYYDTDIFLLIVTVMD